MVVVAALLIVIANKIGEATGRRTKRCADIGTRSRNGRVEASIALDPTLCPSSPPVLRNENVVHTAVTTRPFKTCRRLTIDASAFDPTRRVLPVVGAIPPRRSHHRASAALEDACRPRL